MSATSAATKPARSVPSTLLASVVVLCASAEGVLVLGEWTAAGTVPGARHLTDTLPVCAWGVLAALSVLALVRRASLERCALAALAWSFAVSVSAELPAVASSHELGDGPALAGVYLALGGLTGAWVLTTSIADARQRAIALVVFWSAANARLWGRESDRIWVLAWIALLFALGCSGAWQSLRSVWARTDRRVAWATLLLLVWIALAAALSDSPTVSATVGLRAVWGALLAGVIACSGRAGARRVWAGLLASAAAVVIVLAAGLAEAASHESFERVLASRLRLLGLHSNLVAPFFALSLCLVVAEILRARSERRLRSPRRLALFLVGAGLLCALLRSESRASALGAVLGLAGLAWCLWAPAPRRLWTVGLAGCALVGLGLAWLATPLAAPLHERLRALTFTQSALGQRYYMWSLAARDLAQHPLFGAGPNVYYLHARHAEPSFYDGTPQTLHSHSLFVGVAEGSGWIGVVLLVLVCIGTADALRRAARAAGSSLAERALAAGMFAALVALLASNAIDVGQSRNTFVPLVLWIALGFAAACRAPAVQPDAVADASASNRAGASPSASGSDADGASSGARRRAGAAAVLLVPLAVLPALSFHFAHAARAHLDDGELEAALASGRRALALWPLEPKVRLTLFAVRSAQSDGPGALAEAQALVAASPGLAAYHMLEARAELALGQPERARAAAQAALRCDPRGPDAGEASFLLAGALLRLGDRPGARDALLTGFRAEADGWRSLPQVRHPEPSGAESNSHGIAFLLGDPAHPTGSIQLDALLGALEREVRETPATQPVDKRRRMGAVVHVLRALGDPRRALAVMDEVVRETGLSTLSFDMVRIELCDELGRIDEAEAIRAESPWKNDGHIVCPWAKAMLTAGGPERIQRVIADAPLLVHSAGRDVFFDTGTLAGPLALAARIALQMGDGPRALDLLRRARYDRGTPIARLALSKAFLAQCAEIGPPKEIVFAALGEVLFDASLDTRPARDERAMLQHAKLVRRACRDNPPTPAELEPLCAPLGEAGATFLRVYRQTTGD
jgi:tetratricopeptide (TPR) repeat protein